MSKSTDKVQDPQAKINQRIREVSDRINKQFKETGDKVTSRVDQVKERTEQANELARNIWLAGLGAYGKTFDEALAARAKLSKDAPALFHDLVRKGEYLETEARGKFQQGKNSLAQARNAFEARLTAAPEKADLESLKKVSKEYIAAFEEKVEELKAKIEGLVKSGKKEAGAAKKPATRKASARKATAKKPATKAATSKAATRKASTNKSASNKPATSKAATGIPATKKPAARTAATKKPAAAKATPKSGATTRSAEDKGAAA